ncbi:MAG: hypothetical protein JWR30_3477, partial [Conexibacter sp.]|nr:hypothetical protein [Conexibacter sp.]
RAAMRDHLLMAGGLAASAARALRGEEGPA